MYNALFVLTDWSCKINYPISVNNVKILCSSNLAANIMPVLVVVLFACMVLFNERNRLFKKKYNEVIYAKDVCRAVFFYDYCNIFECLF